MGEKDDAEPFILLREKSQNLQDEIKRAVENCEEELHSKLTSLISDSEMSTCQISVSSHPYKEFTLAKYEIFTSMSSMCNDMEANLLELVSDLKKSFLESVELFLAKTKLEVKLPPISPKSQLNNSRRVKFTSPPIYPSLRGITVDRKQRTHYFPPILPDLHGSGEENSDVDEISKMAEKGKSFSSCINESLMSNAGQNLSSGQFDIAPKRSGRKPKAKQASESNETTTEPKCNSGNRQLRSEDCMLINDSGDEVSIIEPEVVRRRGRSKGNKAVKDSDKNGDEMETMFDKVEEVMVTPLKKTSRRKTIMPNASSSTDSDKNGGEMEIMFDKVEEFMVTPLKKTSRRKTIMPNASSSTDIPEKPVAVRSKRKTVGTSSFVSAKRAKKDSFGDSYSLGLSQSLVFDEPNEDGGYVPWSFLHDLRTNIPSKPGVYELKVSRAKKAAYIMHAENLHEVLNLHKQCAPSGNKRLDKFLERNAVEVNVRFVEISSLEEAKMAAKERIDTFVKQHKSIPAFN